MSRYKFINLFVYSDSLGFRRTSQQTDLAFTYPFLLKEQIEKRIGLRVNLLTRGSGGATIGTVASTLWQDSGYVGGNDDALNIAVIQCGIVDCAPRPFTYVFVPALRKTPVVGRRLVRLLSDHREALQSIWSYRATSRRRFSVVYARIVSLCQSTGMYPIAVGLPAPTLMIERRSPGFRRSVATYNELIKGALPNSFCDVEEHFTDETRDQLLLDDGHHLSYAGHRLYADLIANHVDRIVRSHSAARQ